MKIMKIYLISNAIAAMVFIFFGAFYTSQSYFIIGGLGVLFSLTLWIALGYYKHQKKSNDFNQV
jgi:hypothetical protein